jgi:hypothetical protein
MNFAIKPCAGTAALLLAATMAGLSVAESTHAQATSGGVTLPMVPKTAEFNVPLNFSNLPPAYYRELEVFCGVYETPEPPPHTSVSQLAANSERVQVVNGTYNGVVKVKVNVRATDVVKVKSWRCQVMAIGPSGSGVNQFNLMFWPDMPEGAKPDLNSQTRTGAAGKYN